MAEKHSTHINYNEETNEYTDCAVSRGFPMGGMGSGGFSLGTDGVFAEFRINNNWMKPVRNVRGTFFAIRMKKDGDIAARILRRRAPWGEYENITPIRSTRFKGELPEFVMSFDDDLPVRATLRGFTPHVPHNVKDSTIPAALFSLQLENITKTKIEVASLFSWENILGLGGTGNTGMYTLELIPGLVMPLGNRPKLKYTDVTGNYQEILKGKRYPTIAFKTKQSPDSRSHQYSTIGEYRIAADLPAGFRVSQCEGWNAFDDAPAMLNEFVQDGKISSPAAPITGSRLCRTAAALCVSGVLPPKGSCEMVFCAVWWMPNHTTEKNLIKNSKTKRHDGVRVGHVYENFFRGPDEIIWHVLSNRKRLREESMQLSDLLDQSTLPAWLIRAMKNSRDSTLCNTVIPKSGDLFTLEGVDWQPPFWPFGGLTGTNDQRISAHPYISVFFTDLDKREVDAFRRHMRENGSCPHGNGNCDLSLDDADVPYGWPMKLMFALPEDEWVDLNMSEIIQAGKLYRITGDRGWIKKFWPDMKKMAEYLHGKTVHGVPEGGTTYDIWTFPGTFLYVATLYLAAMKTMIDRAGEVEPAAAGEYQKRFDQCAERVNSALWRAKGYFSSTQKKKTLFTGGLAGQWASLYTGLGTVLPPERVESHLKLMYHTLIESARRNAEKKGRIPFPWPEATPKGSNVKLRSIWGIIQKNMLKIDYNVYTAQIHSYHAMVHLYHGQVEQGFDVMKMVYDLIYKKGYTWSAGLHTSDESIYMTHPVIWAVLNALTGAALDVPRGILHLSPNALPGQTRTDVPFCFPGFWEMMLYDVKTGRIKIEIRKHFGQPVALTEVHLWTKKGEKKVVKLKKPLRVVTGAVIDLSFKQK